MERMTEAHNIIIQRKAYIAATTENRWTTMISYCAIMRRMLTWHSLHSSMMTDTPAFMGGLPC